MQLEFHQLDRRWEHLRVHHPGRQRAATVPQNQALRGPGADQQQRADELAGRGGVDRDLAPAHPAIGALVDHITGGHLEGARFSPMNVNYGLLPPLEAPRVDAEGKRIPPKDRGRAKKRLMSVRAIEGLTAWRDAA